MSRHSNGLVLCWELAGIEAGHAGAAVLDPEHFVLGICKFADMEFDGAIRPAVVGREELLKDLRIEASCISSIFSGLGVDIRLFRRKLRREVGHSEEDDKEKGQTGGAHLRRSERSRVAFRAAENLAEAGDDVVRPLHLLIGVLLGDPLHCDEILAEQRSSVELLLTAAKARVLAPSADKPPQGQEKGGAAVGLDVKATGVEHRAKKRKSLLDRLGRDITQLARDGKLELVIGRKDEMRQLAQVLLQKRKNNAIVVGEAGVGKTCIVEGFAQRIVDSSGPPEFARTRIVEITMASLVAGTTLRGEFEERLQSVIKEASEDPNLVLFIDEIHTMMGAGKAEGAPMDAANILKPALARGEIRIVGATTSAEYRRFIEKDAALERRFQAVWVEEPTRDEALAIVEGLRSRFEAHHGLRIADDALSAAVDLSIRHLRDFRLPDKAVDLIDQACSQSRFQSLSGGLGPSERGALLISRAHIAAVVARRCRIPLEQLTQDEVQRLSGLEDALRMRVKGQDAAIRVVSEAIRTARAGLRAPNRPVGVFLLAGPTGTGKTELAKALAEFMFGDEQRIVRVDMSELMEQHSVSKLIGSPPGYIGHDEGGRLTDAMRSHPYSVVLLDEIEKAHPRILDLFLQVFDEGSLQDAHGRKASFRDAIILLTTNLGSAELKQKNTLGFGAQASERDALTSLQEAVNEAIRARLRPELLNRFTQVVVFNPLTETDAAQILDKLLNAVNARLVQHHIVLDLDNAVRDRVLKQGFSMQYGARELERTLNRVVAQPLSEAILRGELRNASRVKATLECDKVIFTGA